MKYLFYTVSIVSLILDILIEISPDSLEKLFGGYATILCGIHMLQFPFIKTE